MATIQTYNRNVATMVAKLNDAIKEMNNCNSASVDVMQPADLERLASYLADYRSYLDYVVSKQSSVDLPETSPQLRTLPDDIDAPDRENKNVNEIVWWLQTARDEIKSAQSSRLHMGLLPFDVKRQVAVIDTIDKFVADHLSKHLPLDRPESAPAIPVGPAGNTGV